MKITVKVFDVEKELFSKVFEEGAFRAGRSEFCELVLPGEQVSRSHVEFRVTASTVYLTNMGTAGKLKLNDKSIETAEAKDGDEIKIGPYRLFIFFGEKESQSRAGNEGSGPENAASPRSSSNDEMIVGEAAGLPENAFFGEANPEGVDPLNQDGFAAPLPNENRNDGAAENSDANNNQNQNVVDFPANQPAREFGSQGNLALSHQPETVIESKPLVAKLIFIEGSRQGDELPLQAFEVSFGRSRKADVFLDDEKLSRIHAKITRMGMGYRLIDLNSRNGTYVNGMRVLEHPLNSFDVIELGNTKIKFLIHDMALNEGEKFGLAPVSVVSNREQTKSLQMSDTERAQIQALQPQGPGQPPGRYEAPMDFSQPEPQAQKKPLLRIILIAVVLGAVALMLLPSEDPKKEGTTKDPVAEDKKRIEKPVLPPSIPKDYAELSPEMQRKLEGYYAEAVKLSQREDLKKEDIERGLLDVKRIHEALDYYKNSRDLQEQFSKRLKEKLNQQAAEKAKRDEKQDLAIYLEDGLDSLKQGEFDRASEAFQLAINLDPRNETAAKGLKAAEAKVRDLEQIPPERDPEAEKKKLVHDLFEKAMSAFSGKSYQDAIDTAEKIRKVELKGDTQYLNEAKQIIDRAKMLQKEEFEPFLIQAKEKFAEGDYNASRDLCDEMLKRDPSYEDVKECVLKAKKQLNRLAKEAYTHGYILESMGRLEEAKQYYNRAKNYVRPGDDYFNKVVKKLEAYQ